MIPNILHFVFGLAPDFGNKPFSLVHYLAVKSAVALNNPTRAHFHFQHEPQGEFWQEAKQLLTLNRIIAPTEFMGRRLHHFAHQADVVRLQALKEHGGIYLDLDTISVRPLTSLLHHSFVIGQELKCRPRSSTKKLAHFLRKRLSFHGRRNPDISGLCNAVMLAEPNSDFVNLWLNEYKRFRSTGHDEFWNEHSVLVPERLSRAHPDSATILDPYAFHYPLYDAHGLSSMFEHVCDFPHAYVHHLWESKSWDAYLSKLTIQGVRTEESTYNRLARRFL